MRPRPEHPASERHKYGASARERKWAQATGEPLAPTDNLNIYKSTSTWTDTDQHLPNGPWPHPLGTVIPAATHLLSRMPFKCLLRREGGSRPSTPPPAVRCPSAPTRPSPPGAAPTASSLEGRGRRPWAPRGWRTRCVAILRRSAWRRRSTSVSSCRSGRSRPRLLRQASLAPAGSFAASWRRPPASRRARARTGIPIWAACTSHP
mmetsp:Transcript_69183/g.194007  ORF Transcript_69183/g.194007 Transcript_69183/m.194007 type:complete len:206 (-) Transcript_69183:172-789(-)